MGRGEAECAVAQTGAVAGMAAGGIIAGPVSVAGATGKLSAAEWECAAARVVRWVSGPAHVRAEWAPE